MNDAVFMLPGVASWLRGSGKDDVRALFEQAENPGNRLKRYPAPVNLA